MMDYDELIAQEVADYNGPHQVIITEAPAFYRLLLHLLDDPALPGKLRPMLLAAAGYFTIPADIMPEDLQGPHGYLDDIFLTAYVAERVRKETGSDDMLVRNWDGQAPLLSLIKQVLSKEEELIDDKRDLVLWYVGEEYWE